MHHPNKSSKMKLKSEKVKYACVRFVKCTIKTSILSKDKLYFLTPLFVLVLALHKMPIGI